MSAAPFRPIRISIHALGGQGGGVLADWIVGLAEHEGWIAQATSVPGVAQRTGATVYYLELCPPDPRGRSPVLALMPIPGDVDLVIASELMEAGRAMARGLVTPDRTVLVASSQRVMAISEKSAPGDGAMPGAKVVEAARTASKRLILADFAALADRSGSVISAALFGATAASGALPFGREAFEASIRRGGVGVESSLRAFASAFDLALTGPVETPAAPVAARPAPRGDIPLRRRLVELPEAVRADAGLGIDRCLDYQGQAHAGAYLDRVISVARVDAEFGGDRWDWRLSREIARRLALWMTYEDVIRVADLKTRATRTERVRAEVRAAPDQIVEVAEFVHPRFEEVCDTLPHLLGAWLKESGTARRALGPLFASGRRVKTTSLGGFLTLYALAALRPLRPGSHRYRVEAQRIDAWMTSALNAARTNYDLGVEIAALQRLVKGYGETHERGLRRYGAILQTLQGRLDHAEAAGLARSLARAALEDDSGRRLADAIAAAGGPSQVVLS